MYNGEENMYSNKSNSKSIALAKTTSNKRGYVIGLGLLLALLMLVASFFVARPMSANAEVTTTPTETATAKSVCVDELWNPEADSFNSENLAILQMYIYGGEDVTPTKINELAEIGLNSEELNSKSIEQGFYKDVYYNAKTSEQNIVITLHGYKWNLVSLYTLQYGEFFKYSIMDIKPCIDSDFEIIRELDAFKELDKNGFAIFIDFDSYDPNSGVVPFKLSSANNMTFNLINARVKTTQTDTTESVVLFNNKILQPNIDYKYDSTIVDGEQAGSAILEGLGMYDYGEESVVEPYGGVNSWTWDSRTPAYKVASHSHSWRWIGGSTWTLNLKARMVNNSAYSIYTKTYNYSGKYTNTFDYVYAYIGTGTSGGTQSIGKCYYTIDAGLLSNFTITWSNYSNVYSGSSFKLGVSSVKYPGASSNVSATYYSLSGTTSATAAGTYTAKLTGNTYLTGSVTKTWYIYARSISSGDLWIQYASGTAYCIVSIWPSISLTVDGKTLTQGTDFTRAQTGPYNAGDTATITLTGKGNYQGKKSGTFKVVARNIDGDSVHKCLTQESFQYTGSAITVDSYFYIYYYTYSDSHASSKDYSISYSNNVNAGTATMTITGKNNFKGTTTKTFTITARSITNATMANLGSYDYTGSAIKPTPSVTDSGIGKTLVSGTDFTYSYSNNTAVGTATVTATGKGNYTGSISKNFTIIQRAIDSVTLSSTSFTYDAATKSVSVTVKCGSTTLSAAYYSISGTTSAVNEGTYTVTVHANSPYTGSKNATWKINERTSIDLTALSTTSYKYTGSANKPTPTVKTSSSGNTISSSYYTITYTNNVNVGTATCKVTGNGTNVATSATDSMNFTISARPMSDVYMDSYRGDPQTTYTGAAWQPKPELTYNGMTLVEGTDFTYSWSNSTNVGNDTGTVTATGKGNYTGSISDYLTILQRAVSTCTLTYSSLSFTYNGSSQGPNLSTAKYSGNNVTTVTLSGNRGTNAGSYTLTATGSGNLTGTTTKGWTILARNMSNTTIASVSAQTYTGAAIKPTPAVTDSGLSRTLTSSDYTLSYSSNTAVGTATITATGKGNYTGTQTKNFTISARAASTITYTYSSLSFTYTGSAQGPTITSAKYGSNSVTTATISGNSKTAAGTYTATITGSGNLSGTTTVGWSIGARAITAVTFSTISAQTYTTSAITQSITLKYNNMTLTKGTDYTETYTNNVNVGTATITFKGNGNYSGSISKTFAINARAISSATFDSIANQTYTTSTLQPTPVLRYGNDSPLVLNTDYKNVSYSNNINVGTATITVTGMGNYTGTHSTTFTIVAKALESSMFAGISNKTYTTADIKPTPSLTFNGKTLVSGTDYQSITYANNHNVGTATVTVTGKGNYKGNASTTFNIIPRAISDATVNTIANQTYTGVQIKPVPTLYYSNDNPMVAGTDYSTTYTYANNTNVGTATVTITGKGNYNGTTSKDFTIVARDIKDCTIELSATTFTYNTSTQSVSVTVKIGSTTIANTNYTVSGNSAKNQGTYTVSVSGKNNLSNGSDSKANTTKSFVINRRNVSDVTIADIPHQRYIHDGNGTATAVTLDVGTELSLSYINDNPMTHDTDYTYALSNATTIYEDTTFSKSGNKPTVTITGKGNYTGTKTKYFIIYDNNLALDPEASVTIPYTTHIYTGHAIKPIVTAKWSSTTLTLDTDYKVSYSSNTNVGTATVTITGIGAYHGVVTITFTITAADIAYLKASEMTLSKDNTNYFEDIEYTYTGKANNPTPRLKYNHSDLCSAKCKCSETICNPNCAAGSQVTLTNNTDYTYTITNNINAGTALVTFTGKGNYTGTNYTSFVIKPQTISSAQVSGFSTAGYEYTGRAITPDFTVTYNNGSTTATLEYKKDYSRSYSNNIDAGQATVTITGIGNFTGTTTATFKIISVPADKIEEGLKFENFATYLYTGSAITPEINASYNTVPMKKDVDFTVKYTNNTNVGTATATIAGITGGNFAGITISKNFTITAKNITELEYASNFGGRYEYTGSQIKPVITLSYNGMTLASGTDFNVTYTNNVAIGQGTINITAKGNYTGTITGNFTIFSYSMAQLTPTLDAGNTTYRGKDIAVKPAVTLNDPEAQFTVSYTNNFKPGTATATITGTGRYSGTKTINYEIGQASVSSASMLVTASDAFFTDDRFNPDLTFAYTTSVLNQDGTVDTHTESLVRDVDFRVTNIEVDTANFRGIATVEGLDGFTGTRAVTFNILARDIATVGVNSIGTKMYTGEEIEPEIILTFEANTLVEGIDYELNYRDNINAGTAYIDITGLGNYGGTRTLSFEIAKRRLGVNPTYTAEDIYYEYGSLPQLVDERVAEYGEFEWLVPNFIAGTNEYEWNFLPYDRDNYEILSGSVTFTAVDISIERIETEFVEGKEHKAYDTFNSDNVTIRVLYSNGVYQELEAKDYKVSLGQNEHMVAGEIIYVTVEEGGQEFTESMGIVKARPITVTFGDYANLTENGENQTITVDVEGLLEGYENAYSIVYHNLSNGTIGNSITTGGSYRVEVIVTDNNYVIDGANSITFNVKSQVIENANVTISSDTGFAGGSTIEVNTYETAEAFVSALGLENVDLGGRYLRAYTFDIVADGVVLSNNNTATSNAVKVALTAEDIVVSDALRMYAVRNGEVIAINYTYEDGKFVFDCELRDVIVFVEEVEEDGFNWAIVIWPLVGLLIVGAVIGMVLFFDKKNKKDTKKTSKKSTK